MIRLKMLIVFGLGGRLMKRREESIDRNIRILLCGIELYLIHITFS